MEKYLSIGELSTMKGVSHRALRHYGELGILVPAYVNPETGYRYYSKNQILILDMITLCVALGIPLKTFKKYILKEGSIDAKQMIEDAKLKALDVQKNIEQKLYFLETATEHFMDAQKASLQDQVYTKRIQKRYFLTTDAPKDFEIEVNFWTKMTELYKESARRDFAMAINQGMCFWLQEGQIRRKYFVEIQNPESVHEQPDIVIIPDAEFVCEFYREPLFLKAIEKYQAHNYFLSGNICIVSDIFEDTITYKPAPFEVQLLARR